MHVEKKPVAAVLAAFENNLATIGAAAGRMHEAKWRARRGRRRELQCFDTEGPRHRHAGVSSANNGALETAGFQQLVENAPQRAAQLFQSG